MGGRKRQNTRAPKIVSFSPLTGSIAVVHRGRESNRVFMIVGGSDTKGRVYIADGRKRRLSDPKLKNLRHMTVCDMCQTARELLPEGKYTDGDIRRAIIGAEQKDETPKGESNAEG